MTPASLDELLKKWEMNACSKTEYWPEEYVLQDRILSLISELREAKQKLNQESVERDRACEQRNRLEMENIRLSERNKWAEERFQSAEEALQYYSHPDHYEPWKSMGGDHGPGVLVEKGEKARTHFEKFGEKE